MVLIDDLRHRAALRGNEAVLALDIGGTKIEAGLVTLGGRLLVRHRMATPAHAGREPMWEAVRTVLDAVRDARPDVVPIALGCGCGGPMTSGGETVTPLNIPSWRDEPLRDGLESLVDTVVGVDNDAKALTLAEGWVGAAASSAHYMAMVVSTGVGGGLVLDGRLLDGRTSNAGHIGHVIVEPGGRRCSCGARGCLEAEASGSAIAAITGRDPRDAEVAVRERTGRLVGRAVAAAANLLDLDLVLVAGGVALGYGSVFFDAARSELALSAQLDYSRGARILPAGCGDEGPLIGAAAVAIAALDA